MEDTKQAHTLHGARTAQPDCPMCRPHFHRKARVGRNPLTGQEIQIQANFREFRPLPQVGPFTSSVKSWRVHPEADVLGLPVHVEFFTDNGTTRWDLSAYGSLAEMLKGEEVYEVFYCASVNCPGRGYKASYCPHVCAE